VSRKKKKQVQTPDFLQTLSVPPDGSWPQGAFYHGMRIGLLVLLAAAITLLFPSDTGRTFSLYQVGDVVTEDVAAEVGFEIPKDSVELERQRAEVAAAVPPVFLYHADTQGRIENRLNGFFDRIQEAVEGGGRPAVEAVLVEEELPGLVENVENFLSPIELQALRQASLSLVRQFVPRYLNSEHEAAVLSAGQIHVWAGGVDEGHLDADGLLWGTDFYAEAMGTLGPSTPEFQSMVRQLLTHFFESPYSLDPARTDARLSEARSAVPTTEGSVVEGEYIVRRGDQIGPSELRHITAHQNALQSQGLVRELGRDWSSLVGKFLLNLLLLSIFGILLFFYRREIYGSFRWVLLLASLVFLYFLAAAGISWQGYPWELLPIAFVILPVAILWDGRMALILALVLGVLSGAQEPFDSYRILAFTLIGGAAAALSARAVRRRSQTWIFIALITAGYTLAITAFALMGNGEPGDVPVSIFFAAANATVSAILAMGFMPVFEWFTGITTDQTLLEWADPNRPLLKSLSLEASGTYAHTINVANLAEAAATSIGANGLLARVGIYYHDVGKMLKPQYFVENQPGGRNPHDKLKPHTSAAIVREHVIEGERMAREEGVPDVVARFIPEHHGTQLIGFFYERAKEESEEEPNPEEFRYPGPKPRSKETAIAMLADSVESATRALQDPSPKRVQELVKTIVDGKIRDGQLSEAPLTLREINLIQVQFVKVVGGMFHHRLDYPATRHITEALREDSPDPSGGAEKESQGSPLSEAEVPEASEVPDPAQEGGGTASEDSHKEQLPLTPTDAPPPSPGRDGS
jgi:putative nucleotidyltransferase with HDIG domain